MILSYREINYLFTLSNYLLDMILAKQTRLLDKTYILSRQVLLNKAYILSRQVLLDKTRQCSPYS